MSPIVNITPIIITLVTAFGVLFHDTHLDRATTAAIAMPIVAATAKAAYISSGEHTHVERVAFQRHMAPLSASLPKVQPRDDDRRYILNKKMVLSGGTGASYLWPSV